ncbi:MAG: alpha/beta hydrolase [Actinomycetota bacterium]|nr:alpha/beta hydrolase [Actinomycetota bacterium]
MAPTTKAAAAKGTVMRSLMRLPKPVIRKLAGKPVVIDGKTLHPEMQLVLRLEKLEGPAVETLPITRGRKQVVSSARLAGGSPSIGAVTDRTIDGPAGKLNLRFYTPSGMRGAAPALFFIHGGGWIYGDLESHDATCRFLAEEAQVRVIAVDYRLAPEAPFPAAFDDTWAAYQWIVNNAQGIGVDIDRLAVGGDSAGGNLAAIIAQQAVREGFHPPTFQLLIYPATDFVTESASRATYAKGYYLTKAFMDLANENYLLGDEDLDDPRLSPVRNDVAGVAPVYVVTAGFDPLLDEGKDYADKLRDAGVRVDYRCEEGLIHGFANMVALGSAAPKAMRRAAAALARGLS